MGLELSANDARLDGHVEILRADPHDAARLNLVDADAAPKGAAWPSSEVPVPNGTTGIWCRAHAPAVGAQAPLAGWATAPEQAHPPHVYSETVPTDFSSLTLSSGFVKSERSLI
jgi:hypothetical protein